jgi:hypothetical protein
MLLWTVQRAGRSAPTRTERERVSQQQCATDGEGSRRAQRVRGNSPTIGPHMSPRAYATLNSAYASPYPA